MGCEDIIELQDVENKEVRNGKSNGDYGVILGRTLKKSSLHNLKVLILLRELVQNCHTPKTSLEI